MKRRARYALASLVFGTGMVLLSLAPGFLPRRPLPRLSAPVIFQRAEKAWEAGNFSETLRYRNLLMPPVINLATWTNLPLPGANVSEITYAASRTIWRVEELTGAGDVVAVVAGQGRRVVTFQGERHQRTITILPRGAQGQGVWGWPTSSRQWSKNWRAHVSQRVVARVPVYQVTLTPKKPDSLYGSVTYWFHGQFFLPMGMAVTDRTGRTVFSVRATAFSKGNPGSAAALPTAGTLVNWRPSPALEAVSRTLSRPADFTGKFPSRLGPLSLIADRKVGAVRVGIYGRGLGRVIVVQTPSAVVSRLGVARWLLPIAGHPRDWGLTDGLWSVVKTQRNGLAVILAGSRKREVLAQWADQTWPRP